jgi:hypothetical protein
MVVEVDGVKSVLVRGIHLWNQLPFSIKNVRSVAAFETLRL